MVITLQQAANWRVRNTFERRLTRLTQLRPLRYATRSIAPVRSKVETV